MAPTKDISGADGVDQLGAHAAVEGEYVPASGDLVKLHDGHYAIVLATDPVAVLRLGKPETHELPVSLVG